MSKQKSKWIQRDLEDQIKEELGILNTDLNFLTNKTNIMAAPQIKISDVLELLNKGYSRLKKDDTGVGSVQVKYGLNGAQTKELFNHPALKGKKRKVSPSLDIIDDVSGNSAIKQAAPEQSSDALFA